MKSQKSEMPRIRKAIETFLQRAPVENSSLVLDGTGMNASYQYVVMALLGLPRLLELQRVDIVSGSSFAALVFLASRTNCMPWRREDLGRWVKEWPGCYGISPLTGGLKSGLNFVRRKPLLDPIGVLRSFEKTVTPEFGNQTVADLPANYRFWLYDATHKKLVSVDRNSSLKHMPVKLLVRCCTAVPRYFGSIPFEGIDYSDPVYSPLARELRKIVNNETKNTLVSNMFSDKQTETNILLKPHAHRDGKKLILRDFSLFLLGISSREVVESAENGLFDVNPIA